MEYNITPICNRFNKRPNAFLEVDNARERMQPRIIRGRHGKVLLDEKWLPEFFLWVSDETRDMVLAGRTPAQIVQHYSGDN